MTDVLCLVSDSKIGVRACVDAQITSRCWCPKAVLAVNEVSPLVVRGTRLAEQIETLKHRAAEMYRKPAADRYDGPALRKVKGLPDPTEVPLPVRMEKSLLETVREGFSAAPPPKRQAYTVEGAMTTPARHVVPAKSEREQRHEDALAEQEKDGGGGRKGTPGDGKPITHAEPGTPPMRPRRSRDDGPTQGSPSNRGETTAPVSTCKRCGTSLGARNKTGFCSKSACQRAAANERAKAAPRCETPGCDRPAYAKKKCGRCTTGVRPDGGLLPCATPNCPKSIQKFRGEETCHLCRRGLTHHLLKGKPMARKFCACGKEIRKGRDGETHEKCRSCRIKTGDATKSRKKVPAVTTKKAARAGTAKANRIPLSQIPVIDVWVDFDPKTLTTPQLTACVRELWKRIQAKDQEKREAELALANEPPGQAA
jgi:hypothetical protein